jgi:hypothetical protein
MGSLDQARDTQLRNIEAKTGKSLAEFRSTIAASGLSKHGEIRTMLMGKYGLGYGDANSLVHFALSSDGQSAANASGASTADSVGEIYSGSKAVLRPIHDAVMVAIRAFGPFETIPKKGYVSLRRKKQFAMVGPGTKSRLEVGINMKDVKATPRLVSLPPGGMCQYKVYLVSKVEVDKELVAWIRRAYDASG